MEESHYLLWKPNKNLVDDMRDKFEKKDYQVHIKELNTKENGIPHCRPRVFIVAIKPQGRRMFKWPKPLCYTVPLQQYYVPPWQSDPWPLTGTKPAAADHLEEHA